MKGRILDIGLLVALGVIGLAIIITLFAVRPGRGEPEAVTPEIVTTEERVEEDAPKVEAISPERDEAEGDIVVVPAGALEGTETPEAETSGNTQELVIAEVEPSGLEEAEVVAAESEPEGNEAEVSEVSEVLEVETLEEREAETVEADTALSLPEGAVPLSRIGFSFVTGGAGACSIPLLPWQHVAVSRDLLETYPCGTEVTITLPEPIGDRSEVTLTVADTMSPTFGRTVNIYVGEDEPALEYGVLDSGTLEASR